jgi:hypothetical protein
MTLGILTVALGAATGPSIVVPRSATPIVIDAKLEPAEWARAAELPLGDGTTLKLQHDGTHLYVGITAQRAGFVSLCTTTGDTVRVLHASAALGSVSYTRSGDTWASRDTAFTYAMRNTDSTEEARQERRTYLTQHSWVSSTVRMSQGHAHEMQIALERVDRMPRIAVAFFVIGTGDSWSIQRWPAGIGEQEGCMDSQLVRGYVPRGLRFDPTSWAELRL